VHTHRWTGEDSKGTAKSTAANTNRLSGHVNWGVLTLINEYFSRITVSMLNVPVGEVTAAVRRLFKH
jgi:hypothetical protein